MANPVTLRVSLIAAVQTQSPYSGSPSVGIPDFVLALNSSEANPVSLGQVGPGDDGVFDLTALTPVYVAGQASSPNAKGWIVRVIPDGTGATPSGYCEVTASTGQTDKVYTGGIIVHFPNTGGLLTETITLDMSTAVGLKAQFSAYK